MAWAYLSRYVCMSLAVIRTLWIIWTPTVPLRSNSRSGECDEMSRLKSDAAPETTESENRLYRPISKGLV